MKTGVRFVMGWLLILLLSQIYSSRLHAQSSLNYNWYVNANSGVAQAYCDLQEENNHISKLSAETNIGYGLRLGSYISPVFAAHTQFLKANLKGSKKSSDAYFEADLLEFHLGATVNLSNLIFGINHNRKLALYGTTGFGLNYFRSEARRLSNDNLVNSYGYTKDLEGKKDNRLQCFIAPLGLGADLRLAKKWYMNIETVLRLSDSDKVDAIVSGKRKDAYYYTSLGLSYNFGKKSKRERIDVPQPVIAEVEEVDSMLNERVDLVYVIPEDVTSNSEFTLKYIIHKGCIDGFGELMQILPIGFDVLDTVIDDARFEFRNYTLNLYWDVLPEDSVFEISYRVHVNDVYGNLPITSILYFDRTGKEYKFKRSIYIEKQAPEEIVSADTLPEEPPPVVGDIIEFKVQVRAAYKARIPLQRLANKYHLRDSIREDYVGNWYRYSVGSFATYAQAREYRDILRSDNKVLDAFVVAFRNGVRLNSLSDLKELPPSPFPEPATEFQETGIVYRVQILALLHNRVTPETLQEIFGIDEQITEESYDSWRKYTVGRFTSLDEAKHMRQKMIGEGIMDAFIVIYKDGKRISPGNPM